MYRMENLFRGRRGLWVMIFGAVFARHPALKLIFTEHFMDWLAYDLPDMDGLYKGQGIAGFPELSMAPSEYFKRNVFIGASFMSSGDAKLAIEHDWTDNIMWGDDYPHAEGTWPLTRESIRFAFSDIDPKYTRKFLGENAINVYGFDRDKLAKIAEKIGPTLPEVATSYAPLESLPGSFAFRSGPGKYL
jgi:predicted TIM-barrel fold metal-dependent hydrolase